MYVRQIGGTSRVVMMIFFTRECLKERKTTINVLEMVCKVTQ